MKRLLGGLCLAALVATPALGQGPRDASCLLQVLNVDRQGVGFQPTPETQNWYAGGNVRMRCVGQEVRMWSDSLASYQGQVIQFIGSVRYRDSTIEMTADFGTYFRETDRWEARGNVVLTNRRNGAILRGPTLDYLRPMPGVRDTSETFADLRPTITIPAADSLDRPGDPYVIIGDRVRVRGNERVFVGGRVTIDRADLEGRADSMQLDASPSGSGALLGAASMRQTTADSFDLRGQRIDLTLEEREVTYVLAQEDAHLRSSDLNLQADTIGIDLESRRVEQVVAWGGEGRPHAVSADGFEIRGDSVAFDTPDQRLAGARAFGSGWMGSAPDSVTAERDFISGDTVAVAFREGIDSTGAETTQLDRLEAQGNATTLYRVAASAQPGQAMAVGLRRAIVYTHAERILITMKTAADGTSTVDEVRMVGGVDGIHMQPVAIGADSARVAVPRPPAGGRP